MSNFDRVKIGSVFKHSSTGGKLTHFKVIKLRKPDTVYLSPLNSSDPNDVKDNPIFQKRSFKLYLTRDGQVAIKGTTAAGGPEASGVGQVLLVESEDDTERKSILMSGYDTDGSALASESNEYQTAIFIFDQAHSHIVKRDILNQVPELFNKPIYEKATKFDDLYVIAYPFGSNRTDPYGKLLDKIIDKITNGDYDRMNLIPGQKIATSDIKELVDGFSKSSGRVNEGFTDHFVNPINRDAHDYILQKILANPLWKNMDRYYRLINTIKKTCPEHIRTAHCDRDQIVSHLKKLKCKGESSEHISDKIKNYLLDDGWVYKKSQDHFVKRLKRNDPGEISDGNVDTYLNISDDGRWFTRLNGMGQTEKEIDLRKYYSDSDVKSAVKEILKENKDNQMKKESITHKTYLVSKHLKPADIAIEYGVTMSIIGREGDCSLAYIEGEESDVSEFIKEYDIQEFDVADSASPADTSPRLNEAVEDAFKESTGVEAARMALVKGIAKDAPVGDTTTESGLSKLNSKMINYDIGTITAFRAGLTRDENRARNKQLLAFFLNKGYSVTKVKGSYIEDLNGAIPVEVGEESFFIADIASAGKLLIDLKRMGAHFDQDSILFKAVGDVASLYGTSDRDSAYPGKGKIIKLGSANMGRVNGQFFSRIKGRQFAFESIADIEYPGTINGIRGMKLVAATIEDWNKLPPAFKSKTHAVN